MLSFCSCPNIKFPRYSSGNTILPITQLSINFLLSGGDHSNRKGLLNKSDQNFHLPEHLLPRGFSLIIQSKLFHSEVIFKQLLKKVHFEFLPLDLEAQPAVLLNLQKLNPSPSHKVLNQYYWQSSLWPKQVKNWMTKIQLGPLQHPPLHPRLKLIPKRTHII